MNDSVSCPNCNFTSFPLANQGTQAYEGLVLMVCTNTSCTKQTWHYCNICMRKLSSKSSRRNHRNTKKHQNNISGISNNENSTTADNDEFNSHDETPSETSNNLLYHSSNYKVNLVYPPAVGGGSEVDLMDQFDGVTPSQSTNPVTHHSDRKTFLQSIIGNTYSEIHHFNFRFFKEEQEEQFLGVKTLVARALIGRDEDGCLLSQYIAPSIRKIDGLLMLYLANFCRKLSPLETNQFCRIVNMLQYVSSVPVNAVTNHYVPIPKSPSSIRRTLTTGKYSISERIPMPEIISVPNHSIILPSKWLEFLINIGIDIFADRQNMMTEKNELLKKTFHDGVFGSKRFELFLSDNNFSTHPIFLPIAIIIWSDDFEPNSTVQNRNSVWTVTVTFVYPTNCGNSEEQSFVVTLGQKGLDHEEAKDIIMMDVRDLLSRVHYYFNPTVQLTIPMKCYLHTILGDTPERRTFIHYAASSGLFSCWFGFSVILPKLITLPSCKNCFDNRCNNFGVPLTQRCRSCSDWELDVNNNESLFEAPDGYPSNRSDVIVCNGKNMLRPMKVTFESMKLALVHSFDM